MSEQNIRKIKKSVSGRWWNVALVLVVVLFAITQFLPNDPDASKKALCRVLTKAYYAVPTDSGTLCLPLDTLACADVPQWLTDTTLSANVTTGVFVSEQGHFMTSAAAIRHKAAANQADQTKALLTHYERQLMQCKARLNDELVALQRYSGRHTVVDDGYNEVMAFRSNRMNLDTALQQSLRLTRLALKQHHRSPLKVVYRVQLQQADGSWGEATEVRQLGDAILCQTANKRLPKHGLSLTVRRFISPGEPGRWVGYNDVGQRSENRPPVNLSDAQFRLPASDGGVWLDWRHDDVFAMTAQAQGGAPAMTLSQLLTSSRCLPLRWYDRIHRRAVAFYNRLAAQYDALLRQGQHATAPATYHLADASNRQADGSLYQGEVLQCDGMTRTGYGVLTLKDGTRYEGEWDADTLISGTRWQAATRYDGRFNHQREPNGYGELTLPDGECYYGEWRAGEREGLGFSVRGSQLLRCGTWRKDKFRGERMVYTQSRIYGIDISRYQHEIGKKRYGIDWSNLTITDLGVGRRVSGVVHYPVRFIYIKATEGKSVLSKYYAADLAAARSHGIIPGTYHFFSTQSSGTEQALYFLRNASIAATDLPPVLDVEPSDAQIAKMGGDEKLFKEVEAWLRVVKERSGRKPVLYISQSFVNNHLPHASDYVKSHDVWIARYGEFKPDVNLLHWQLTPYGRVRGIHGEVDINVFNGTADQFADYLKNM